MDMFDLVAVGGGLLLVVHVLQWTMVIKVASRSENWTRFLNEKIEKTVVPPASKLNDMELRIQELETAHENMLQSMRRLRSAAYMRSRRAEEADSTAGGTKPPTAESPAADRDAWKAAIREKIAKGELKP